MITERTHYFAAPGRASEVLAIRRRACAIRVAIGLPAGRIQVAVNGTSDQGDVIWECSFPNAAAHKADLGARDESADFGAIRALMTSATRGFSRQLFEADEEPLANGLNWLSLEGYPIVPQELTFPSAGLHLKGYLFLPPGSGPFPLMVCNHGSGIAKGALDVSRPGGAALLMSWGIASFLPHRHGYGNSPGPAWRDDVNAPFGTDAYDAQLAARLNRESADVVAALDFLSALPVIRSAHIGVMGSSFGGVNTLLAAAKTENFKCAIDFAGAAMNWDHTPGLRSLMIEAARALTQPIFLIQAENDFSTRPTRELASALDGSGKIVWSKTYPTFGVNAEEAHLFESRGSMLWAHDARMFLERYL